MVNTDLSRLVLKPRDTFNPEVDLDLTRFALKSRKTFNPVINDPLINFLVMKLLDMGLVRWFSGESGLRPNVMT